LNNYLINIDVKIIFCDFFFSFLIHSFFFSLIHHFFSYFHHYQIIIAIGLRLSSSGEAEDLIKGNGVLEYAKDLGIVEDTDPGLMIVSWKLNVGHEKAWEFTRKEWLDGWAQQS